MAELPDLRLSPSGEPLDGGNQDGAFRGMRIRLSEMADSVVSVPLTTTVQWLEKHPSVGGGVFEVELGQATPTRRYHVEGGVILTKQVEGDPTATVRVRVAQGDSDTWTTVGESTVRSEALGDCVRVEVNGTTQLVGPSSRLRARVELVASAGGWSLEGNGWGQYGNVGYLGLAEVLA